MLVCSVTLEEDSRIPFESPERLNYETGDNRSICLSLVLSPVPAVLVQCAGHPEGLDGQGAVPGVCL